jgi:hypothetical protein
MVSVIGSRFRVEYCKSHVGVAVGTSRGMGLVF